MFYPTTNVHQVLNASLQHNVKTRQAIEMITRLPQPSLFLVGIPQQPEEGLKNPKEIGYAIFGVTSAQANHATQNI
jgi:hypothetical protein